MCCSGVTWLRQLRIGSKIDFLTWVSSEFSSSNGICLSNSINSSVVTAGLFVVGLIFSAASMTLSRSCSITSSDVGYILLDARVQIPEKVWHSIQMRYISALLPKTGMPSSFHFPKLFYQHILPIRVEQIESTWITGTVVYLYIKNVWKSYYWWSLVLFSIVQL